MKIWNYIKSDLARYTGKFSFPLFIKNLIRNRSFKYSFWLRLTRHKNLFIRLLSIFMHKRLTNKYLIQIPRQTQIGYGLYIGHHMCIVISPSAKIGNNVNLSQFTTIGSNYGNAADIGDNVYIGPNVNIIENVIIGDNSTIGAGSVVTKDVPENSTVAGVPAKVISYKKPGRFVNRRWKLSANEQE
jgi:serine O-acetyltransferase